IDDFSVTPVQPLMPKSRKILFWLIGLAGLLAVLSVLALFVGGPSFRERDVEVKLEGPNQIVSGDEATYTLTYENKTKTKLKDIRIMFWYPKDSVVLKADGSIARPETESFSLDELKAGQRGEKEIKTFLVGDRGNIKEAKVRFAYYAGSFKSLFEKDVQLNTTITSVPIPLTLVAPPNAVSGHEITYILDYRNETSAPISDLQFEFLYPDGFQFVRSSPTSINQRTWTIPVLKNGGGSRIMVTGILRGSPGEAKNISATLKRKLGDQYIDFVKVSNATVIANPLLKTTILVNDGRDHVAYPGDTLRYTVRYENTSNFIFSGLTLKTTLSGTMFDLSSLQPQNGVFDESSKAITWDSGSISDFGNLSPNTKGEVSFSVRLKPSFSTGSSSVLKVSSLLRTENVPQSYDGNEIRAEDSLTTRVSVQPSFSQSLYYNDPAFGSTGPFPPEVGKETTFTVHWAVFNPGNPLAQAKITSTLPTGVVWKNVFGKDSGLPDPVFNKNTSEVSWNIGTMPQNARYELSFQLVIKPTSSQKGSPLVVLKNVKLTGTDSVLEQPLVINGSDLKTDNTADQPGGNVQ